MKAIRNTRGFGFFSRKEPSKDPFDRIAAENVIKNLFIDLESCVEVWGSVNFANSAERERANEEISSILESMRKGISASDKVKTERALDTKLMKMYRLKKSKDVAELSKLVLELNEKYRKEYGKPAVSDDKMREFVGEYKKVTESIKKGTVPGAVMRK
jgi:hypothetical protein